MLGPTRSTFDGFQLASANARSIGPRHRSITGRTIRLESKEDGRTDEMVLELDAEVWHRPRE